MDQSLKRIECDPKCGFIVQSHDDKEVLEIAKRHAKEKHNMDATYEQLKGMMKSTAEVS